MLSCSGTLDIGFITIQNYGTNELTSLKVEIKINNKLVDEYVGGGVPLATYETTTIPISELTELIQNNDLVTITITLPNNKEIPLIQGAHNVSFYVLDSIIKNINPAVTVKITTDDYGSETTWDIKDSDGVVVRTAGPFNDLEKQELLIKLQSQ